MFEKAGRMRLRFGSARGSITVEDLWALPLISRKGNFSLDDLAKRLSKEVKDSSEESFVMKRSRTNAALDLKFEIVKHIIKVRLDELEQKENAANLLFKKKKILEIIAGKEDEELAGKSVEDLKKLVEGM